MIDDFNLTVTPELDGKGIKEFLHKELRFSSSLIKKVKYGGVFINGSAVTMRATVSCGDIISIRLPKEASENIEPIYAPLNIIYEDEDILAVNKPANMPVHPSRGNHLVTLANAVMAYYKDKSFVFRAVGRLDRDTSGVVVIAKNAFSAAILSDDMKNGNFEKYYTALLSSVPKEKKGIIEAPIERECEGSMRRVVRIDGKAAKTEYEIVKILPDGRAVASIRLYTGRTHQIRVHMAHIGSPLYADHLYGERVIDKCFKLCCTRLVFPHPRTGKETVLEVKPDFET